KVPTVLVLDRIATALDTTIARLLGEERASRVVVLRHSAQDVARDPSGWERRILSPVLPGVEFELMRTTIAPGGDAGVSPPHARGSGVSPARGRGALQLRTDGARSPLRAGDSLPYAADCHPQFATPGREPCFYYPAIELTEGGPHTRRGRALPASARRRS